MLETSEQQRARILAGYPETAPWEYDLAVALGFKPESFDGMWSLVQHPFLIVDGIVHITQVVLDGNHRPVGPAGHRQTRQLKRPLPDGWAVRAGAVLAPA